ncbi:hypothetical protein [Luteibacter sp. 9145]|uniref:hypothetical protein n=1 Tax=Luteibacter sp. 9145 TaxID=1500892 RepID=UPI001EFAE9BF|nr:hypothetical protein [Luteibacter sp. 9145]
MRELAQGAHRHRRGGRDRRRRGNARLVVEIERQVQIETWLGALGGTRHGRGCRRRRCRRRHGRGGRRPLTGQRRAEALQLRPQVHIELGLFRPRIEQRVVGVVLAQLVAGTEGHVVPLVVCLARIDATVLVAEDRFAALAGTLGLLRHRLAATLLLARLTEQPEQHHHDDADEEHRDAHCGIPGEADGGIHGSISFKNGT